MKKYIITETQFNKLVEKKKKEKETVKNILENIEKINNRLNESELLNEAVVDVIKKYLRRGLLTVTVLASLMAQNVQASDLLKAGVPEDKIEKAIEIVNKESNSLSIDRIESKLLSNWKSKGFDGEISQYQNLPIDQRNNMLDAINSKIKSINDINKLNITVTDWKNNPDLGSNFSLIGEKETIVTDTVITTLNVTFQEEFNFNSAKLNDPNGVKSELQKYLNMFEEITEITIKSSSSTLRNTGEFENKTWIESSTMRANSIKELLTNINYNLGGCGANESNSIDESIIKIDVTGENGDGTSGPPSTFEKNNKSVEWYTNQGIDSKFWKSNGQGNSYENIEDYKQHQYVNVYITGHLVAKETNSIVNYKFVKIMVQQKGGKIKLSEPRQGKQNVKVLSCTMKN